jgi:hypothetical protein
MFVYNPGELLLEVLLEPLGRALLLGYQTDIVVELLEGKLGIDNLLLLRLEIPFEVRELIVKRHQCGALVFKLCLGGLEVALLS